MNGEPILRFPLTIGGNTPMDEAELQSEARVLARHLMGDNAPAELLSRYTNCVRSKIGAGLDDKQNFMTSLALKRPTWIGPLDAFLGIYDRNHDLRKRLLIMAALMETTPNFAPQFLSSKVSSTNLMMLALRLIPTIMVKISSGAILYVYLTLKTRV